MLSIPRTRSRTVAPRSTLTVNPRYTFACRATLTSVLGGSPAGATAVLVGSSAGGVASFNVATWLLGSFDQVGTPCRRRPPKIGRVLAFPQPALSLKLSHA